MQLHRVTNYASPDLTSYDSFLLYILEICTFWGPLLISPTSQRSPTSETIGFLLCIHELSFVCLDSTCKRDHTVFAFLWIISLTASPLTTVSIHAVVNGRISLLLKLIHLYFGCSGSLLLLCGRPSSCGKRGQLRGSTRFSEGWFL